MLNCNNFPEQVRFLIKIATSVAVSQSHLDETLPPFPLDMEKTLEDSSPCSIAFPWFLAMFYTTLVLGEFCLSFSCIFHCFMDSLHHAWKMLVDGEPTCPEGPFQSLCSDRNLDDKKPPREEKVVAKTEKLRLCENVGDDKLSMGDVKAMMDKLGTLSDPDDESSVENLGSHETVDLFEEEPRPEEVAEAFDMFDQNKDGFIDAGELGKVLSTLGLMEPSEVESRRMIRVFDDDGDGRIDLTEFVKLLEHRLS